MTLIQSKDDYEFNDKDGEKPFHGAITLFLIILKKLFVLDMLMYIPIPDYKDLRHFTAPS